MSKYTKGPWEFIRAKRTRFQRENDHLILNNEMRHIAEVFQYQNAKHIIGLSEAQANARLISAAPDLLEVCKMAEIEVNKWHSLNVADQDVDNAHNAWKCLMRLNQVIAKAEGRYEKREE
ncbi:hypothetical protein LCGC14_0788620 [marine sediment metagenome]|uniref:Uncharacterized protein n=1 Tax=marine sediment metagenome TaxID=412755 RepID=A0A0F9SD48_9ZZZZ